jgi:hypothetical protein
MTLFALFISGQAQEIPSLPAVQTPQTHRHTCTSPDWVVLSTLVRDHRNH